MLSTETVELAGGRLGVSHPDGPEEERLEEGTVTKNELGGELSPQSEGPGSPGKERRPEAEQKGVLQRGLGGREAGIPTGPIPKPFY